MREDESVMSVACFGSPNKPRPAARLSPCGSEVGVILPEEGRGEEERGGEGAAGGRFLRAEKQGKQVEWLMDLLYSRPRDISNPPLSTFWSFSSADSVVLAR